MSGSGDQIHRLAFDAPVETTVADGVTLTTWLERHVDLGRMLYHRGSEVVDTARLSGRSVYKIRIGQCRAGRAIDQTWRMRDVRRGLPAGVTGDTLPGSRYAIREVDAVTDPQWIYLVVESGVEP